MCETSNYAGGKNARNSTLKQLQNSACRSSTFPRKEKDRGAMYRGMKENSKHIPNKIEQNCNNQKSSLNDLRWRGGRWPQRTWTNTSGKVARIARICVLPHFKRRTNVNPETRDGEVNRHTMRQRVGLPSVVHDCVDRED